MFPRVADELVVLFMASVARISKRLGVSPSGEATSKLSKRESAIPDLHWLNVDAGRRVVDIKNAGRVTPSKGRLW